MARKLSKRLMAVANMVPNGAYLADIGSDHAQLPIYLCQSGKISWAQAIENKVGPFLNMSHAIEEAGLSGHIDQSKSDGLSSLNDGVDCVAICGMGGMLACDILQAHPEKLSHVQTILLDPHKDLVAVRERVTALGFYIQDEAMVYEDKIYYSVMRFDRGQPEKPYSQQDYFFGPVLRKKRGEVFEDWLKVQLKRVSDLLNCNLPPEKREHYLALYRLIRDEKNRG